MSKLLKLVEYANLLAVREVHMKAFASRQAYFKLISTPKPLNCANMDHYLSNYMDKHQIGSELFVFYKYLTYNVTTARSQKTHPRCPPGCHSELKHSASRFLLSLTLTKASTSLKPGHSSFFPSSLVSELASWRPLFVESLLFEEAIVYSGNVYMWAAGSCPFPHNVFLWAAGTEAEGETAPPNGAE